MTAAGNKSGRNYRDLIPIDLICYFFFSFPIVPLCESHFSFLPNVKVKCSGDLTSLTVSQHKLIFLKKRIKKSYRSFL